VVISFDVDGPSGMMNRNPAVAEMPSTRSMGEYGPVVAAPLILELLRREQVPASFYFPGWVAERYPRLVERVRADGHEVAHHGYLHEPPATLSRDEEAAVLDRTNAILRGITGEPALGYRSPSWELSRHSVDLLRDRGFRYDSSLMGQDLPYLVGPEATSEVGPLVELPVHWSLDDYPHFNWTPSDSHRLQASPSHVLDVWMTAFDELYDRGGMFMLTMHPYVIGRPSRLGVLARLLAHIRRRTDVAFYRSIDVAAGVTGDWGTRPVSG
jgi:peptidoglycan/xylan/chitin deacetylase (PgdA/CDA1 family)